MLVLVSMTEAVQYELSTVVVYGWYKLLSIHVDINTTKKISITNDSTARMSHD